MVENVETQLKKSDQRIQWVDIAKGIAILLMIIGHEIPGGSRLYALIFSFHMPLFFILSGYTSKKVANWNTFLSKTKKSFYRIWLLAIVMIVINTVLQFTFWGHFNLLEMLVKGMVWGSNIPAKGIGNVGVMWFLIVFFWAKMLFSLLLMTMSEREIGICLLGLSFISYLISSHFWLIQGWNIVPFAALFMWGGYVARNSYQLIQPTKWRYPFILVATILWAFLVLKNIHIELAVRLYPFFIVSIIEAFAGAMICCLVAQKLVKIEIIRKIFEPIGKHTLALLCIHHLDFYWITWDGLVNQWYLAVFLRTALDLVAFTVWLMLLHSVSSKN